jgi:hypothetical protein
MVTLVRDLRQSRHARAATRAALHHAPISPVRSSPQQYANGPPNMFAPQTGGFDKASFRPMGTTHDPASVAAAAASRWMTEADVGSHVRPCASPTHSNAANFAECPMFEVFGAGRGYGISSLSNGHPPHGGQLRAYRLATSQPSHHMPSALANGCNSFAPTPSAPPPSCRAPSTGRTAGAFATPMPTDLPLWCGHASSATTNGASTQRTARSGIRSSPFETPLSLPSPASAPLHGASFPPPLSLKLPADPPPSAPQRRHAQSPPPPLHMPIPRSATRSDSGQSEVRDTDLLAAVLNGEWQQQAPQLRSRPAWSGRQAAPTPQRRGGLHARGQDWSGTSGRGSPPRQRELSEEETHRRA